MLDRIVVECVDPLEVMSRSSIHVSEEAVFPILWRNDWETNKLEMLMTE